MKKLYLPLALLTLIGANSYLYAKDQINKGSEPVGTLTINNCNLNYSKYSNPFRLPSLSFSFESLTLSRAELLASGVPESYFPAIEDWKEKKLFIVVSNKEEYRERFKSDWSKYYDRPYYGKTDSAILIAAGSDKEALAARYSKSGGYIILNGHVRPTYQPKDVTYFTLAPRYVSLAIPAALREEIDALLEIPKTVGASCKPEYTITVKWGSSGIPWIDDVGKIDG